MVVIVVCPHFQNYMLLKKLPCIESTRRKSSKWVNVPVIIFRDFLFCWYTASGLFFRLNIPTLPHKRKDGFGNTFFPNISKLHCMFNIFVYVVTSVSVFIMTQSPWLTARIFEWKFLALLFFTMYSSMGSLAVCTLNARALEKLSFWIQKCSKSW